MPSTSPTSDVLVYLDGEFVPWKDARIPVEDRSSQFGDAIYEETCPLPKTFTIVDPADAARCVPASRLLPPGLRAPAARRRGDVGNLRLSGRLFYRKLKSQRA